MKLSDLKQLTYTNENVILSHYRNSNNLILVFPECKEINHIYEATHEEENWKHWVDSAGKADKTSDFYSKNFQMMMEVMRFDDKAFKKGKRNPTLERESEMLKELANSGILESFPNLENIHIGAVTDLPTGDNHNFNRFRDNFVRVVKKHSKQVETYIENHQGHKLIFFIFDETSGVYHRRVSETQITFHFYWVDSVIVNTITKSASDFVIWYKPYNAYLTPEGMQDSLTKLIIYDMANMQIKKEYYDARQMISSEV